MYNILSFKKRHLESGFAGLLVILVLSLLSVCGYLYLRSQTFKVPQELLATATPTEAAIANPSIVPNEAEVLCQVGSLTLSLNQSVCDTVQAVVSNAKKKDIATVTQDLNNTQSQYNQVSNTVYVDNNKKTQDCITSAQSKLDAYNKWLATATPPSNNPAGAFWSPLMESVDPSIMLTPSMESAVISGCNTSEQSANQLAQGPLNQLGDQINWYKNYLSNIPNGVGNGACSDHGGANCSHRGDLGQVICNDGWSQSQVYYLNVEECVKYLISITPK